MHVSGAAAARLCGTGPARSRCLTDTDELHQESCRRRPCRGPRPRSAPPCPRGRPSGPPPSPPAGLPGPGQGPTHLRFLLPLRLPPKHWHSAGDCPSPSSPVGLTSQAVLACRPPAPLQSPPRAEPPHLTYTLQKTQGAWSPDCMWLPVPSPLSRSCHPDGPASATTLCLPRGCLPCSPCSGQLKLPCHLP